MEKQTPLGGVFEYFIRNDITEQREGRGRERWCEAELKKKRWLVSQSLMFLPHLLQIHTLDTETLDYSPPQPSTQNYDTKPIL